MKAHFLYRLFKKAPLNIILWLFLSKIIFQYREFLQLSEDDAISLLLLIAVVWESIYFLVIITDKYTRFVRKYFPIVIFAIGYGNKRYQQTKNAIYAILSLCIIPFLINYILKYLWPI